MSKPSSPGAVVLLAAVICGGAGFAAGRITNSAESAQAGAQDSRGTVQLTATEANARLADVQRERDELRQRLAELSNVERVEVASPPTEVDGMSAPTDAQPTEATAATEIMDAASTLAAVRTAIADGNAEAMVALRASVSANGETLAPDLIALLDNADSLFASEKLAELLGEIGDQRALPALHALLEREADDAVRTSVVRALGQIPDDSSVALLTAEFGRESSSPMPPSLAATSLGQIASPGAIAALRSEIENGENGMVRAFAMRALTERRDPALVPFFFTQVNRPGANERSRKQAIEAIAGTGARTAIPELENLAFSTRTSRGIQEAAKRAINQILGETRYPVR